MKGRIFRRVFCCGQNELIWFAQEGFLGQAPEVLIFVKNKKAIKSDEGN